MSHFQPVHNRPCRPGVLRSCTATLLGLTLFATAPVDAQKVQTLEPEARRAPTMQRRTGNDVVLTTAQNAALQRDFDLLMAAYKGETWNVRDLLAKGAGLEARDGQYGFTPLMYAAANGHLGTVRFLINKGAKVNARSRQGVAIPMASGKTLATETIETQGQLTQMNQMPILICESGAVTPLFLASAGGYNLTVRELLKHGADAKLKNPDGDTPLMYAAFKGYLPSVEALVARGANINAMDRHGGTAISLAAWQGHLPVVRYLLHRGAKVNTRRSNGWTPITYAQAGGNKAIERMLRQAAAREARSTGNRSTPVATGTSTPATSTPVPSAGSVADGSIIIVR